MTNSATTFYVLLGERLVPARDGLKWIEYLEGGGFALEVDCPLHLCGGLTSEDYAAGWWDTAMDASYWWDEGKVSDLQAALILYGINPIKGDLEEAEREAGLTTHPGGTSPDDFRKLRNTFAGLEGDKARTLKDWLGVAKQKHLKHHSWIDEWLAARGGDAVDSAPTVSEVADVITADTTMEAALVVQPVSTVSVQDSVESEAIDFAMLATPDQLIGAFGTFSGMDASWFDKLSDTPRLAAARKIAGRGGQHSVPPLFCPFQVMEWMADPKRKKGRPVNEATAWRMMEKHFPRVYASRSIGDPRQD